MIVLDASALVDLLLGRPAAAAVQNALLQEGSAHVPELADIEVLSALRRWEAGGDLTRARAGEAVDDLAQLRLVRYGHGPLLPLVWQLRDSFSPYDATYVALAHALGGTLLTSDGRLARGAKRVVALVDLT
ncbi:MAG: type II toxin-antitoxin system VapC family toxin [Thermoleophilaceae bacterium]|nr:type II toxin-antitoxin system VapC family toxin [Thermoleophilaceae bacterium]